MVIARGTLLRLYALALLALFSAAVQARGVSPYLPLSQSPEIERKIERLLILADVPVLTRPIAAAMVLDALPKACERDAVLCEEVRRYLNGYMRTAGIGYASLAVGGGSGADTPMPNRHGMTSRSNYELAASVYWQPREYWLVTGGVQAYEGDSTPTGTMLSFGSGRAQFDVGYRDHWLSPLTESAMLLSTQAPTMPSITVSNYEPLSRWRLRYEAFFAQMSESRINSAGNVVPGKPRLAGVHLSIEPFPGWSIGVNRVLQFGGDDRPDSLGDLLRALFDPSSDNTGSADDPTAEFGNQAASLTSRFTIPAPTPMAVYFEYAGEDTSTTSNFRLGNTALAAGVQLPNLANRVDLTVEIGEWQNAWYEHHIYLDGLRNEGRVIGHWGADWRTPGDEVGARSWLARIGWTGRAGAYLEATYRTLDNESYGSTIYERAHLLDFRYSRPWRELQLGAELNAGRDSIGESFGRISVFARF
jgi:hypothetical protein